MLLLDENISDRLASKLAEIFPGITHVKILGLERANDDVIWQRAIVDGLAITSKDSDFLRRSFLQGSPPKVVWLRLGNCMTDYIFETLRDSQSRINELVAGDADFLVLP